jgi:hypothetical protein
MSFGKDVKDAFNNAIDQARHDYGHAGYTGTIAEKHSFVMSSKPKTIKTDKWIDHLDNFMYDESVTPPMSKYTSYIRSDVNVYDDKWGPALAFELSGVELKRAKEQNGLKGTRKKGFIFIGMASY